MARTVRDFKNFVLQQAGVSRYSDFCARSERHIKFWQKLNHLGAKNIEIQPPETVPDIDATVVLSDEEWSDLVQEFQSL